MIGEAKHKQLEESLYRRKRAFTVIYIFFILVVCIAASLAASVCTNTADLVKSEDNTLTNDALACFAVASALCFAFFVVFSATLYIVFFFMNPKSNEDSIRQSSILMVIVCMCTLIMVVAVCTQSFGNEDLFSCIRNELNQDPIKDNTTGQICFATTWFVACSAALMFTLFGMILSIRTKLVNTLMDHLKKTNK